MKPTPALAAALLALAACGGRRREPERTTQGTSLNLNATAVTPQVHINPQDGGATQLQIGNAQVRLPGEAERGRAAERAAQEGAE